VKLKTLEGVQRLNFVTDNNLKRFLSHINKIADCPKASVAIVFDYSTLERAEYIFKELKSMVKIREFSPDGIYTTLSGCEIHFIDKKDPEYSVCGSRFTAIYFVDSLDLYSFFYFLTRLGSESKYKSYAMVLADKTDNNNPYGVFLDQFKDGDDYLYEVPINFKADFRTYEIETKIGEVFEDGNRCFIIKRRL
jgi:hypothetical protein